MTVLEILAEKGPLRPAEIAARLGKRAASIRAYLARLVREGQVTRLEDGRYALTEACPDDVNPNGEDPSWLEEPEAVPLGRSTLARTTPTFGVWLSGLQDGLAEVAQERHVNREAAQALFRQDLVELGLAPTAREVDDQAARALYARGLERGRRLRRQWLERRRRERECLRKSGLAWLLGSDDEEREPPDLQEPDRAEEKRPAAELLAQDLQKHALREFNRRCDQLAAEIILRALR